MPANPPPSLRGQDVLVVRRLALGECRLTARLHRELLPHGFFARLGPRFLAAYHRAHVRSEHAVALVAVVDGQVAGFLLGVVDPGAHGRSVVRTSGLRLAALGCVALLLRPALLLLFLRTRAGRYARGLHRRIRPVPRPGAAGEPAAVLQHVAVHAGARQAGIGGRLVAAFEEAVSSARVREVVLLTMPAEDGAPAFYRRLGYQEEGLVRGADGEQWLRYRRRV